MCVRGQDKVAAIIQRTSIDFVASTFCGKPRARAFADIKGFSESLDFSVCILAPSRLQRFSSSLNSTTALGIDEIIHSRTLGRSAVDYLYAITAAEIVETSRCKNLVGGPYYIALLLPRVIRAINLTSFPLDLNCANCRLQRLSQTGDIALSLPLPDTHTTAQQGQVVLVAASFSRTNLCKSSLQSQRRNHPAGRLINCDYLSRIYIYIQIVKAPLERSLLLLLHACHTAKFSP